ncbi:putative bifunctional chitinase/lysozyme precursor [mine drainage metagenome]|uniref:Putative bifunctional chitinase/lysozyme n=1 Tax=mine drainage metagenome TaxID=410659 RepID=A0A1J5R5I7_9ZZZZ
MEFTHLRRAAPFAHGSSRIVGVPRRKGAVARMAGCALLTCAALAACGGGAHRTGMAPRFVFSPYKDALISMNWSNLVMSTNVTGALRPLLSVLPARQNALTLGFASGECGSETWGGIAADAFAQANVADLAAANVNYIISTGGAAGAFTCGSDDDMIAFVNRYASKNLVGIDFDIEAGQSAAAIQSLVQRVKNVQSLFPGLRWSFTLPTLAPSQGGSQAASWGSAAPDGFNVYGDAVMQAIRDAGLARYTINLMAMDYGVAQAGNCVVSGSSCQMGQSAIQAAMNLHDHWGVPYSQIELTPMIGGNDDVNEVFSLADVAAVSAWVNANGLAGLHFWSFDRDNDCAAGPASPTCNSYVQPGGAGAGTLGFDQAFLNALH